MIPIIDGHLDLAYNALAHDRDQTLTVKELRRREPAGGREGAGGSATVSLPDLRRGDIRTCVATIYVRSRSPLDPRESASRMADDYSSPAQAHANARGQLAYYRMLEHLGELTIFQTRDDLVRRWQQYTQPDVRTQTVTASPSPVGCIIMMEGADAIVTPTEARDWFNLGVRMVSLVHGGANTYAVGTGEEGPLTEAGRLLLKQFDEIGMAVDLSHLSDTSFFEVMDRFEGRICATHNNARRFVPGNRHLTDEQIRLIVQREGVIGVVAFNPFLVPGWKRGTTPREAVAMTHVADQIDHICQITGDARHAAIGSDLDGGFGVESCPHDLDTIADLQKLAPILKSRGYSETDLTAIFHGNWLRFFSEALPET